MPLGYAKRGADTNPNTHSAAQQQSAKRHARFHNGGAGRPFNIRVARALWTVNAASRPWNKLERRAGEATGPMANQRVYAFAAAFGEQPLFIHVHWCLLTFVRCLAMVLGPFGMCFVCVLWFCAKTQALNLAVGYAHKRWSPETALGFDPPLSPVCPTQGFYYFRDWPEKTLP